MQVSDENVSMIEVKPTARTIEEGYTPSVYIPPVTVSAVDYTVPGQGPSTFAGYGDDADLDTPESSQHGHAVAPCDGTNCPPLEDEESTGSSSMHPLQVDDLNFGGLCGHSSFTASLGIAEPCNSFANLASLNDDNNNSSAVIPSRRCTTNTVHHTLTSYKNTTTTHPPAMPPLEASGSEIQGTFFPVPLLQRQECNNFLEPPNSTSLESPSSCHQPSASSTAPDGRRLEMSRSGDAGGIDSLHGAGSSLSKGYFGVPVPTEVRTSNSTCDVHSQTEESFMREDSFRLSSEQKGGKWTCIFFWVLLQNCTGRDTLVRWISQEKLVFQVVEGCTKRVSDIWGRLDTSPYHPSWDNLTGRIRYSLKKKEGYFTDFYKDSEFQQMPRKRCFRFSQHIDKMIQTGKVDDAQVRRMQLDIEKYFLQAPIV